MAVDESEPNRKTHTIDEGSNKTEGETKEENDLIPEQDVISINPEHELFDSRHDSSDSSSIFSSEASLEAHEPEAHSSGFTSLSEEEQKGATNDPPTIENCTNPPQEGASSTTQLNGSSDSSSLISHEPRVASFGEDQGFMSVEETCTSKEPTKPNCSVKPIPVKNAGQEMTIEKKAFQQDNVKPCVGNAKSLKPTLNRVNSAGSDTSSYSFAFPILVPGLPQRATRKTEGINPQGRVSLSSDDPELEGENSISRPSPPPSSLKRRFCCCFCCFPCHSIFSCCFKRSSSY